RYSFGEHPSGGTPASLKAISREDVTAFHAEAFDAGSAVLIFAGDITAAQAESLARKYFGKWENKTKGIGGGGSSSNHPGSETPPVRRILVVDLPNSGQAAVNYTKNVSGAPRSNNTVYYPASVLNSVLGGGYSSRLNQEIRIRRGLSYGAGSSFAWRSDKANFGARTQTKNESAAIVAELVLAEIKRLTEGSIDAAELTPRKSVLTGNFGRNLETTAGLAAQIGELYSFGLSPSALNAYMNDVQAVTDKQIRDFAGANLTGGDLIIVGDYKIFRDDLAKRFPALKIEVVKADELDLSNENLRRSGGETVKAGS
ncbi:MAG: insulinase family protein, partial [Acidobacteriota bacterium]|nr:insulinase family protein [Acidobacteriota bacterium]